MREDKTNIVLIGFMGSGKSTVARELQSVGYDRVDLDERIVERGGRTIPEIFAQEGEDAFRHLETEALRSLAGLHGTVISTGGGIVGREENWPLMRALGPVVYLRAEWETLRARIAEGEGRPLADRHDWKKVENLWRRRLALYARADLAVDTDRCAPAEVAARILRLLNGDRRDKGRRERAES